MNALDCLILADDLTGACDAAAVFARRGRRTSVPLSADACLAGAEVIALNTETRDAAPQEIHRQVAAAAQCAAALRPHTIFKKIDSTLRGQAGVEIVAAMEAFGCEAALMCPAFPKMNRTVEAGWLRVAGVGKFVPVEIVAYLRAQGVGGCAHAAVEGVEKALAAGAKLIALDAACDDDLDRIAAAGAATGRRILWAGSAGLAGALARRLAASGTAAKMVRPAGPVLFCIGSDHAATLAQQAALVRERRARLVETRVEIRAALEDGAHALLRIPRGRFRAADLWDLLAGAHAAALALSGGDTAALVCRAAGAERIDLDGEILPGVPCGAIRGGGFDGMAVATKSGGFGGEDALIEVADYFTCPNR